MTYTWEVKEDKIQSPELPEPIKEEEIYCNSDNPLCQKPKDVQNVKSKTFEKTVYLDNNATHPILPEVKQRVLEVMGIEGNASSKHLAGQKARVIVEEVREQIEKMFFGHVIFTSGGTEANNMALASAKTVSGSTIEHKSVINPNIHFRTIKVDKFGMVEHGDLQATLQFEKPKMISIMTANNEIGVIQNIEALAEMVKRFDPSILVHTDFCQVPGKCDRTFDFTNIDMLSLSGHKLGALTGIGALCVKDLGLLPSFIQGGNQEWGKRAGTYNTVGIASFGEALKHSHTKIMAYRNYLEEQLKSNFDCFVNCEKSLRLNNTTSVTFKDFGGECLMLNLSEMGIFVSTQSACSSYSTAIPHVLAAIGLTDVQARNTIRISLNRWTTKEDIDYLIEGIKVASRNESRK